MEIPKLRKVHGLMGVNVNELTPHPKNLEIYGDPAEYTGKAKKDYDDLVEKIRVSNWIKPVTINPNSEILDGVRRWSAAKKLGFQRIEIELRDDLKTDADTLEAIVLSNAYRENKTPEVLRKEADTLIDVLHLREDAKKNQIDGAKKGGQKGGGDRKSEEYKQSKETELVEPIPQAENIETEPEHTEEPEEPEDNGLSQTNTEVPKEHKKPAPKTRDKVAAQVGLGSGRNYSKVTKVTDVIDTLRAKGDPENEQLADLLSQMLNISVSGAYDVVNMNLVERLPKVKDMIDSSAPGTKIIAKLTGKDKEEPIPKTKQLEVLKVCPCGCGYGYNSTTGKWFKTKEYREKAILPEAQRVHRVQGETA